MTLRVMEGFETSRADTDVRTMGYMYSASGYNAALVPSVTGLTGIALSGIAAAIANTTTAQFNGANSAFGIWTGITVNSAWAAGGFSYGFSATANCSAITGQYYNYVMGSGSTNNSAQICFDGTLYWAIGYNGSAYNLFTSSNLKSWTPVTSLPTALDGNATVAYMGGGVIGLFRIVASGTAISAYYTSNQGTSWSTAALGTSSATGSVYGSGIASGNSSFPHVVAVGANNASTSTNTGGVYVGTLSGTMTQVTTNTAASFTPTMRPYTVGGLVLLGGSNAGGFLYTATASNASLNTTGAWSTATLAGVGLLMSVAYDPTSNLWVLGTSTGIWTFANTGAAGTPVAPTGAITATQRYSTAGITSVFWTGTQLVAHGLLGHVITSPDGATWTEAGAKILPVGTTGYNYSSVINDGTQYVICTDTTTGLVNTSPDGINNWVTQYASHKTPTVVNSTSPNLCGLWFTGVTTQPANPVGTVLAAPSAGETMFGFNIAPVTAAGALTAFGTRISTSPFSATLVFTNNFAGTVATPAQATHYYEIVFTSTATTNAFNVTMYIDGTLVYTQNATQIIAAADTTSVIILTPLPANQQVAQVDDIQLNFIDGQGVSGPLGAVNIGVQRPTTDVSAVWTRIGSAASNALTVNQSAISSAVANYVSSATAGDKDVYSTTNTIPAGYTVKAIKQEAYFSKISSSNPTVNLGVNSGGTESDTPNVIISSTSPTYVNQIWDKNPNGNVAWTNTTVNAAQFVLNHVS